MPNDEYILYNRSLNQSKSFQIKLILLTNLSNMSLYLASYHDEYADISSFSTHKLSKGLLTFYEEQWTQQHPSQTNQQPPYPTSIVVKSQEKSQKDNLLKINSKSRSTHNAHHRSVILNQIFSFNSSPLKIKQKTQKNAPINDALNQNKQLYSLHKSVKSFPQKLLSNSFSIKKEKQKIHKNSQIQKSDTQNILQNQFLSSKLKLKRKRHYASIEIKNVPFDREQQDEGVDKDKNQKQVLNMTKKHNIQTKELKVWSGSKCCYNKKAKEEKHNSENVFEKLCTQKECSKAYRSKVEQYSKKHKMLSGYLFPLISSEPFFPQKRQLLRALCQ